MNLSRRNFMASTALLACVRPDLILAEETKNAAQAAFSRNDLIFSASNDVQWGGFFGTRYQKSLDRLSQEPIDNVDFIIDDVNFNQQRRFFNYSGDISGRYIEICSLASTKDKLTTAILPEVIDELVKYQKPDGHFGRDVDWDKPIDIAGSTDQSLEMPILWGNGRLMLGLFAAYERFGNEKALAAAKKMADFYVNIVLPRFCDPNRIDEYKQTAKGYAAAYVTCVFHGIEGLVRAFRVTGDQKYLDCAVKMADFHEEFDVLPVGHSHGSISVHEALVMLFEETGDQKYLDRVTKRWEDATSGGFVFPVGGVCEKFYVDGKSDEGCSEADWLRLNLLIWRNTGDVKYLDFAERMLYNEYQMNQWHTGGFGHRYMISDEEGCFAWGKRYAESYWCCSYHGSLGYYEFKEYFAVGSTCPETKTKRVYYNFPLDFATTIPFDDGVWKVESRQLEAKKNVPIVSKVTLIGPDGTKIQLAIRIPDWCDSVEVANLDGKTVQTTLDGRYALLEAIADQEFIISFNGRPYAEDRRFHKVALGDGQLVLRYGPSVLVGKDDAEDKIPELVLKANEDGSFEVPDSLTNAYEMTDEERDGAHPFIFNVKLDE
ncbi:MAG: beta-L-arabinofuranosidase domain-containing protein [Thermoguttaceae bacterium]|jgi:DUF1680 family protein